MDVLNTYHFNNRDIYLIEVNDIDLGGGNDKFITPNLRLDFEVHSTFFYDDCQHILRILEELYLASCDLGVVSVIENFLHSFSNGIIRKVKLCGYKSVMFPSVLRIRNDENFKLDHLFRTRLPELLEGRLDPKYVSVYLTSLRASLIVYDNNVEDWLRSKNVKYDIKADPCDQIEELVGKLSNLKLAAISNVIISNRLTGLVAPNTLLFGEMNKIQQKALSIKHNTDDSDDICPEDVAAVVDASITEQDDDDDDVDDDDNFPNILSDDDNDDDDEDDCDVVESKKVKVANTKIDCDKDGDEYDDDDGGGEIDDNEEKNTSKKKSPPTGICQIIDENDLQTDEYGRPKIVFVPNVFTYVFCSKYVLVRTKLTSHQLEYLIQKFLIVGFIVNSTPVESMLKVVDLIIDIINFVEFRHTKIKRNFIDFQIIESDYRIPTEKMVFSKINNRVGVLQSGCPIFRDMVLYNNEQNAVKNKLIEVAARLCPHLLAYLCHRYKITFKVSRTLQRGDKFFTFYECILYINKVYINEFLAQIYSNFNSDGCTHQCFSNASSEMREKRLADGDKTITVFDAVWLQVPCMFIHYHTYFDFFLKYISNYLSVDSSNNNTFCKMFGVANPKNETCRNAIIKQHNIFKVAINNYTMFKYMKLTRKASTILTKTAVLYSFTFINVVKIIDRDIINPLVECELAGGDTINLKQRILLRNLHIRFVEFSGVADGPMVPAVSIRSCEQMRKNSADTHDENSKSWNTNIVNLSMFFNNVHMRGHESGKTDLLL